MKTSPKNRIYSTVSVEEALKGNQETFIQIDGIDLRVYLKTQKRPKKC